jgi:hypothetical protein
VVFEIELIYVFFKNTKKLVQFWTVQYLRSEYGAVDVVFRRLTDWSVDNKFQDFQNENFACFFPNSGNWSQNTIDEGNTEPCNQHVYWTGCEYWPQNYSLGLAWTNSTIEHWDPSDEDIAAQHHVGYIAYYPNCSNWDTDNWSWYLTNMWTQWQWMAPRDWEYIWLDPDRVGHAWNENVIPPHAYSDVGPLTVRYDDQPMTNEYQEYTDVHGVTRYAASPLMLGQWNFTLTSATAQRMAKFVNVMGVTNCSDTFGYVNDYGPFAHYVGDWDSDSDKWGLRTVSEIKYLLTEVFNSYYKLSTCNTEAQRWANINLDVSNWFPFAGVQWNNMWPDPLSESEYYRLVFDHNNTHVYYKIGEESCNSPQAIPDNCTFIYGDSVAHNGMVFTSEGSHVVDVVGGTEVGMNFGSYISANAPTDPDFEAMWDTQDFMGETIGPFVPEVGAPDFFFEESMLTYLDPLPDYSPAGPILTDLTLTALRRMSARRAPCWWLEEGELAWKNAKKKQYVNYFTTPTGCDWNLTHIVAVGGPKVNLATEYFNEHTWAVFTSAESGTEFEELEDGGIYVFPSGNYYVGDGWSVITIADDLNLTSWTAIYDEEELVYWGGDECNIFNTDMAPQGDVVDGPTICEPYAGLIIYGMSGWDTRAAANWFAQYRHMFSVLYTNSSYPKKGATTIILNTNRIGEVCDETWEWGIKEILGPPAGRWRLSESAWSVWIKAPLSITW